MSSRDGVLPRNGLPLATLPMAKVAGAGCFAAGMANIGCEETNDRDEATGPDNMGGETMACDDSMGCWLIEAVCAATCRNRLLSKSALDRLCELAADAGWALECADAPDEDLATALPLAAHPMLFFRISWISPWSACTLSTGSSGCRTGI